MGNIAQDVRYALRQLRKSAGFTAVAVLTLALGIGATTAIFSVVYGVLLRPLPYSNPNRIMAIFEVNTKGGWSTWPTRTSTIFVIRTAAFRRLQNTMLTPPPFRWCAADTLHGCKCLARLFQGFRIQPIIGREFSAADEKKGAAPVVLVSYGYWKQYLGSSPDLSQLHLKIDNAVYSVIGVLPEGFRVSVRRGVVDAG